MASTRRAGWYAAIGFYIAGFEHNAKAAFGVAILLQTIPVLFVIIKAVGVAYLIWIGVRYFIGQAPLSKPSSLASGVGAVSTLRDSIVVEALNPKSALFFLAFLLQFTAPSGNLPVWAQIVVLGIIVNAMFTISDLVLIEWLHLAA